MTWLSKLHKIGFIKIWLKNITYKIMFNEIKTQNWILPYRKWKIPMGHPVFIVHFCHTPIFSFLLHFQIKTSTTFLQVINHPTSSSHFRPTLLWPLPSLSLQIDLRWRAPRCLNNRRSCWTSRFWRMRATSAPRPAVAVFHVTRPASQATLPDPIRNNWISFFCLEQYLWSVAYQSNWNGLCEVALLPPRRFEVSSPLPEHLLQQLDRIVARLRNELFDDFQWTCAAAVHRRSGRTVWTRLRRIVLLHKL